MTAPVAVSPASLGEAVALLNADPDLVPVCGCTDLMVTDHEKRARMNRVLDLLRIPEIHGISMHRDAMRIGATTTFAELARSADVRRCFPALASAAEVVGGWQIQNRATIGGNVANASPAGDSLPVLLALGATIVAACARGEREIAYDVFHTGYRTTALQRGEIIAWIRLPLPGDAAGGCEERAGVFQAFRKVGTREAQAISKVVAAMAGRLEAGRIVEVRVAAGSVAPTPIRLTKAETMLRGRKPDAATADAAGRAAAGEARPIDDVRSTAEYRRFALARIVRRMILEAASAA